MKRRTGRATLPTVSECEPDADMYLLQPDADDNSPTQLHLLRSSRRALTVTISKNNDLKVEFVVYYTQ